MPDLKEQWLLEDMADRYLSLAFFLIIGCGGLTGVPCCVIMSELVSGGVPRVTPSLRVIC